MSDETTTDMLAEIDRDMVEIETLVADLARQALQADYPQQIDTTTEMLAEIEGQAAEYTPPEGWRVLAVGEKLQAGDMWVWPNSDEQRPTIHVGAFVGSNQRYIRRIEPQSNPQPVQVREGRWRTRGGLVRDVTAMPTNHEDFAAAYPWWDGVSTWKNNGRWLADGSTYDLVEYLGPIKEQPQPVPQPQPQHNGLVRDVTHQLQESGLLDLAKAEEQIEELRREVGYVQRLLGESRQRVTQLEELVGSLRTINDAQEKTVRAAGRENVDLQHRLDVVSAEWAEQAATCNKLRQHVEAAEADLVQQRLERNRYQNQVLRLTAELDSMTTECRNLRIELDALQQAPQAETAAAVPTSKDDRFEEGWDAGTARAVETIAEWTEPFRRCGSERLAWMVMQNLPHIMRTLTGLTPED